jgi:hypothetical protein
MGRDWETTGHLSGFRQRGGRIPVAGGSTDLTRAKVFQTVSHIESMEDTEKFGHLSGRGKWSSKKLQLVGKAWKHI